MIWFTSDWHIQHKNVIDFCNRPFASLEEMHEVLVANVNKLVKPADTLVFVGDITFGNTTITKTVIDKINCTCVAIIGNHDPKYGSLLNMGFKLAVNTMSMTIHDHQVIVSHYPFKPPFWARVLGRIAKMELRYIDRRPPKTRNTYLIHGHTHSKKRFEGYALHVGVDAWDYKPVSMKQIETHIHRHSIGED